MENANEYISTAEAAHELGITRQRVLQLIKQSRLKAEKFANVFMIRKADLETIQERPNGRPPKPKAETPKPKKIAKSPAKKAAR